MEPTRDAHFVQGYPRPGPLVQIKRSDEPVALAMGQCGPSLTLPARFNAWGAVRRDKSPIPLPEVARFSHNNGIRTLSFRTLFSQGLPHMRVPFRTLSAIVAAVTMLALATP